MRKSALFLSAVIVGLAAVACRPGRPNMAPRPETFGFPLMEESSLPFEGTAVGPVRTRYGTAYFSAREGFLYCVDVLSRRIVWRFKTDSPLEAPPEVGENLVLVRDAGNAIYGLDETGRLAFKKVPAEAVTTAVREYGGRVYYGCQNGRVVALEEGPEGRTAWRADAGSAIRSGPVFSGGLVIVGADDGLVRALDAGGRTVWTFKAQGRLRTDAAVSGGRLYFGTEDRYFYCLEAATGGKKWFFRLGGAPVQAPGPAGDRLIVAAADSVVYCLRAGSGEIAWWKPVASRVIRGVSAADGVVFVSSLVPGVSGYDLGAGYRRGEYAAAGDLRAGAEWATPYLVLIVPDPASGGEKIVFLKRDRRPVASMGKPSAVRR